MNAERVLMSVSRLRSRARKWLVLIVGVFLVVVGAMQRSIREISGGLLFIVLTLVAPLLRPLPPTAKRVTVSDATLDVEKAEHSSGGDHQDGQ
jgi:hypothetical protein